MIRELLDVPDLAAFERDHGMPWQEAHLDLRFAHLRTAARTWIATALGDEEAARNAPVPDGFPPFDATWNATRHMRDTINTELKAFSLRLVEIGTDGAAEPTLAVDILQVAALQLAQLATEGRQVLRCANEACGRAFTRQRSTRRKTTGRGEYAGTAHAAGVRYCSAECGKAQQARERRRRDRAAKEATA